MEAQNKIETPNLSLPKGGGAIKGISNSFQPNLFDGTGSYSIPIEVSSARGFEPQLSLDYNSAAGNSSFGLGFSLNLSKISIRTDRGIPKYDGSDTYTLNGLELVPKKNRQGVKEGNFTFTEYFLRVEGAFSQIRQYHNEDNCYWKVVTSENVTTVYGLNSASKIANPNDPKQIFEWLVESSIDARGNKIVYAYTSENDSGIKDKTFEKDRALTQKYVQNIRYGNYQLNGLEKYAFEIIFDYSEHDFLNHQQAGKDPYKHAKKWNCRPDSFSSYTSGFEIRTRRLCRNILLFHHFDDELGAPCLVKHYALQYETSSNYRNITLTDPALLTYLRASGFRRRGKKSTDGYEIKSLPALNLSYSDFKAPAKSDFKELMLRAKDGTVHPIPDHLDASGFQPIDLNAEGITGLLYTKGSSLLYFEPLGDGFYAMPNDYESFPVDHGFQDGSTALVHLEGNGEKGLTVTKKDRTGYYHQKSNGTWESFKAFDRYPTEYGNPNLERVGLSGNGKTDLLMADSGQLHIYESKGKIGYDDRQTIDDTGDFPVIKKNYLKEYISFGSLLGDGLSHRIRITENNVECWPCLGYGKFGKKITLQTNFQFDQDFNSSLLYLADINGSGTLDIAYVHRHKLDVYFNENGNSFSKALEIELPEEYSSIDQISFADVLGHGTSCLVFSKMGQSPRHYYYNFVGAVKQEDKARDSMKPYLLSEIDNNMGAVSQLHYCSSTKFYLEDKAKKTPWHTRLPFPVQVVEKVVNLDLITKTRFSQKFRYHDGFYDHAEKEFQGFGYVESWDTETRQELILFNRKTSLAPFTPPVYTRTWHYTGARREGTINPYRDPNTKLGAYYKGDADAYRFPDIILNKNIDTSDEKTLQQARTALKGTILRSEVYGQDKTADAEHPYTVNESNVEIKSLQPRVQARYAVFLVTPRESITYHYERNPKDPRTEQQFILKTDDFGNVLRTCSISLPRRKQEKGVDVYEEQEKISALLSVDSYVQPLSNNLFCHQAYEQQVLEVFNLVPKTNYFSFEHVQQQIELLHLDTPGSIIPYREKVNTKDPIAQQLSWHRTIFWTNNFKAEAPLKTINAQGLIHHLEEAVFPDKFIHDIFDNRITKNILEDYAGYAIGDENSYWWNKGLVQHYDVKNFFLPHFTANDFVKQSSHLYQQSSLAYDAYHLYPIKSKAYIRDDKYLTSTAKYNYQSGAVEELIDANHNISQALFDPLGQVIATSIVSTKDGESVGGMNLFKTYKIEPVADLKEVLGNPTKYLQGATSFFYYNLEAWKTSKQPVVAVQLTRNTFYHADKEDRTFQISLVYSDGFGRVLAEKVKVAQEKWKVTGKSVYDNKGNIVEQNLPYFSKTAAYTQINASNEVPPTVMHYDPLGRLVQTKTPKGFLTKVAFTPWEERHYDENDTLKDAPAWKKRDQLKPAEKEAWDKAAKFHDTYATQIFDNQGHMIREIQKLEDKTELVSFHAYDILGRNTLSIDPRLFEANKGKAGPRYNFRYRYTMDSGQEDEEGEITHVPIYTDSIDAGVEKHLNNCFGQQLFSWSPRNYCQLIEYDRLQRQTKLLVKRIDDDGSLVPFDDFPMLEKFTYGDDSEVPKDLHVQDNNLMGVLYELKDLSGIVVHSSYDIMGEAIETSRQMVKPYKHEDKKYVANWRKDVPLEEEVHRSSIEYNALSQPIKEISPDGSTTSKTYDVAGQLNTIDVLLPNDQEQNIISEIDYDANGQRTKVVYGNGIQTKYTYEATSQNLVAIKNSRQDIQYTYDPVGNITQIVDESFEKVFHNNQEVSPIAKYTYNAIYQLVQAEGRKQKGILPHRRTKEDIYSIMQGGTSSTNDSDALEQYREIYTYDTAGNRTERQHISSSSITTKTPVKDDSNQLKDYAYDAAGNMLQLGKPHDQNLSFNCCNNLVKVDFIQRDGDTNDSEYYDYDKDEYRTRKVTVTKQHGKAVTEEKIYLGNFEIKRKKDSHHTITFERNTLRVMDGDHCVAIIYTIAKDQNHIDREGLTQIRFQLTNHLDSVSLELNEKNELISYEEYFPYGGTAFTVGTKHTEVVMKEYSYSGKEREGNTGLYYYGRRYYASWLGRWLKPDPAGRVDGLNVYVFIKGNVIVSVDINGLFSNSKKNFQRNAFSMLNKEPRSYNQGKAYHKPMFNKSKTVRDIERNKKFQKSLKTRRSKPSKHKTNFKENNFDSTKKQTKKLDFVIGHKLITSSNFNKIKKQTKKLDFVPGHKLIKRPHVDRINEGNHTINSSPESSLSILENNLYRKKKSFADSPSNIVNISDQNSLGQESYSPLLPNTNVNWGDSLQPNSSRDETITSSINSTDFDSYNRGGGASNVLTEGIPDALDNFLIESNNVDINPESRMAHLNHTAISLRNIN